MLYKCSTIELHPQPSLRHLFLALVESFFFFLNKPVEFDLEETDISGLLAPSFLSKGESISLRVLVLEATLKDPGLPLIKSLKIIPPFLDCLKFIVTVA